MKAILILSLMALSTCLTVFITQPAYSSGTTIHLPTTAQNDDECNDSDGDGQCDTDGEKE